MTHTPHTHERSAAWLLGMAGLYFALACGSIGLAGASGVMATPWFANPVGTVALLALPLRRWPLMLACLALANLLANATMGMVLAGTGAATWWQTLQFVPGNCLEMLLAASFLRRLSPDSQTLAHPGKLARTLLLGGAVPTLVSAAAGAMLLTAGRPERFLATWTMWFESSLIGTVAVLPLALAVWLEGRPLPTGATRARWLRTSRHVGMVLLGVSAALVAATSLSQPFVGMTITLVLVAATAPFAVTAAATLATAVTAAALMQQGILLPAPSSGGWETSLFHGTFLATLLPGLFLSASMRGSRQAIRALSASEQRFRALYTQTPAMLHSVDLEGRIVSVSQLWLQTLGYRLHEVLGKRATDFFTPESAQHAIDTVLPQARREGRCDNVEFQMLTRDGHVLDVLLSAVWEYDVLGKPLRTMAVLQDVTEKKRLAKRSHYAEHDPLTGLPNRVLMQDRLERSCAHHTRHGGRFAVGFMDLDYFKQINDTYGHEAGDRLLREVARRLQAVLRASDTVSRVGGDEFVLLFDARDGVEDLHAVARKVLDQVSQPCRLGDHAHAPVVDVAGSLGVALFPDHARDPQTLLSFADQAMYAAKKAGRNRCIFYTKQR